MVVEARDVCPALVFWWDVQIWRGWLGIPYLIGQEHRRHRGQFQGHGLCRSNGEVQGFVWVITRR